MGQEQDKDIADELGISTITLKNWVSLRSSSTKPKAQSSLFQKSSYNTYNTNRAKKEIDFYSSLNEVKNFGGNIEDRKDFHAHCLHQSFEAIAHSLVEKIDKLERIQPDIHHIEIATERVIHNVGKLRAEIKNINAFIQETNKEKNTLENKIDTLLIQNQLIMQKFTHLELMCNHFFFSNLTTKQEPKFEIETLENIEDEFMQFPKDTIQIKGDDILPEIKDIF